MIKYFCLMLLLGCRKTQIRLEKSSTDNQYPSMFKKKMLEEKNLEEGIAAATSSKTLLRKMVTFNNKYYILIRSSFSKKDAYYEADKFLLLFQNEALAQKAAKNYTQTYANNLIFLSKNIFYVQHFTKNFEEQEVIENFFKTQVGFLRFSFLPTEFIQ